MEIPTKNIFFILSKYWHQQQYYLETGTNSSIVSSAVVKVLLWRAWDIVQRQQPNAGGPGFHPSTSWEGDAG